MWDRLRAPAAAREGRTAVVIAALLALPPLRHALGSSPDVDAIASGVALTAYVAVFCASLTFYLQWLLTGNPREAWLAATLGAIALQDLYWFALMLGGEIFASGQVLSMTTVQIVLACSVLVTLLAVDRLPDNRAPLTTAVLAGLVIVAVRAVLVQVVSPSAHHATATVLYAVLVLVSVALAVAIGRLGAIPAWIRLRLGLAIVLLSVGHAAALETGDGWADPISIVANCVGATVLLSTSFSQARLVLKHEREAVATLRDSLADAEAGIRADRSRAHEIRATLGGITAAARLVHRDSGISEARRASLETMMDSELERLGRLLTPTSAGDPQEIDLDSTIWPLVLRHRSRGYPVHWDPSGETAFGRADDVAEVINVLLENAYQHAPSAEVWIDVVRTDTAVEIVVSDSGPGIARSLGERIFTRGRRRPGSAGEGIGLDTARELSASLGGYLRLVDSRAPGATFVLGVPGVPADPHPHAETARRSRSS